MGARIDLKGQRFGMLVAEREMPVRSQRGILWMCRCDCGRVTYLSAAELRSSGRKSCGCLQNKPARTLEQALRASRCDGTVREDCWGYAGDHCSGLLEMFCRTRGMCKFYDTRAEYERKQKEVRRVPKKDG